MKKFLLLALFLIVLCGCQKQEEQSTPSSGSHDGPAASVATTTLFAAPITATRVELPSEALPYWRDAAGSAHPTLLIFAQRPFLQPLSEEQRRPVMDLVRSGSPDAFVARGSYWRTNPAMASAQAVSAALDAGLFSRLVWVFPSASPPDELQLDIFRRQLLDAGIVTEQEAESLRLSEGTVSGTVRGIPFAAVHPKSLLKLDGPLVLHLDLSYFKGLYKNEIKTPIYPMILETARLLQALKPQARAVTLSYSNEEGALPLETRFVITRFAELLRDPELLEKNELPESWRLHSEALYTINFFLESSVTDLYEKALAAAPEDPAILYALALRRQHDKNLSGSLELIERACLVDPGYAVEYLNLADRAAQAKDFANATSLLAKGAAYFPQNPFLELQLANFYLQSARPDEARAVLNKLKSLSWGPMHDGVLQTISDMLAETEQHSSAGKEHP